MNDGRVKTAIQMEAAQILHPRKVERMCMILNDEGLNSNKYTGDSVYSSTEVEL